MVTKTGIIYLQKDKLQLYTPFLASIVEFRFVPEVVRDLDIVNKSLLENLIKTFVTNGKIPPSNLIIVLADNAYFVKDFTQQQPQPTKTPQQPPQTPQVNISMENLKIAADKYIEHVPYEKVVSKTFPLKNGLRVCAVNQDFFESIKNAFEKLNFTIESVIPGMVLGNNMSAKPVMDASMALTTVQKASTLKQYDLLTQEVYTPDSDKAAETSEEPETDDQINKKPNKKRLILMIGVLAILIIVLVIVVVQSMTPPKPTVLQTAPVSQTTSVKQASTSLVSQPPTLAPTSVSSLVTPTIENSQAIKGITVQILNATSNNLPAQELKSSLGTYGFQSITVQPQTGVNTAGTIVSFANTIPQSVRNTVLFEVRKIVTNVIIQERQTSVQDISIILNNK